jgi:hypothetical protein
VGRRGSGVVIHAYNLSNSAGISRRLKVQVKKQETLSKK